MNNSHLDNLQIMEDTRFLTQFLLGFVVRGKNGYLSPFTPPGSGRDCRPPTMKSLMLRNHSRVIVILAMVIMSWGQL